jgi:hypothetical protein
MRRLNYRKQKQERAVNFSESVNSYLQFLGKEIFDMQYIYFDGKGNAQVVGYLERSNMDPDELEKLEVA